MAEPDIIPDIELRWTLRDIRARRFVLAPPQPQHLEVLLARGLVELRDGVPALTKSGQEALD